VASRKSTEKKKVRITNESLVTEPDKGKLTTSDIRPAPTPSPKVGEPRPGGTPSAPTTAAPGAASSEGREEYWRGEVRRVRERVAELKETIARLETETRKLESDFYSWDDGAYRDRVIKPAWDRAREQLATVRKELPLAEKDLADLPDRARKEGALPGWLRE
jgi:exonuclease VII small subunit